MRSAEGEQSPSLGEKAVWWGKIGGIVAAVLGLLTRAGDLVLGGAGVSAASIAIEQTVLKRKPLSTSRPPVGS